MTRSALLRTRSSAVAVTLLLTGGLFAGSTAMAAEATDDTTSSTSTTIGTFATPTGKTTEPTARTHRPVTHHRKATRKVTRAKASRTLSPSAKRAAFGTSVLAEARRHVGTPYVYGATGPGAFDCSGFTSYVYRQLGVSLPRTSYAQYAATQHVPASAAVPGDLIWVEGMGHVAIYAGGGLMYDAPSSGGRVSLRGIYGSYVVGRVLR